MDPPDVISSLQRATRSSQVARHLLRMITENQLRPGDFVPSEIKIGKALAVSRGSAREAYRTLAALGILEVESGRKPRLRSLDSKALSQVFDYGLVTAQVSLAQVTETRRALELHTAALAARHATEAQCNDLRELAAEMRASISDESRRAASDHAIHSTIAEASGNPLNALLLGALQSSIQATPRMQVDDTHSESDLTLFIDAHDAVVRRICERDSPGAASAMAHHFELSILRNPVGFTDLNRT